MLKRDGFKLFICAKRTSRKWGAFFAFASADICFTCRYLAVYLCFLSAFGYSHLFGVWFGFGFRFGFGFAYLYLFMFILRYLKADAAYSLS